MVFNDGLFHTSPSINCFNRLKKALAYALHSFPVTLVSKCIPKKMRVKYSLQPFILMTEHIMNITCIVNKPFKMFQSKLVQE